MTSTPQHSVSVAGIVQNELGQILIIQRRDNGRWEPPGGVLELAESLQQGVAREVLEETGVTIEVRELAGVYKNVKRGVVSLVFACSATSDGAPETIEAQKVRWVDIHEVPDLMDPAYSVRVLDAYRPGVQVRTHDGVHLIEHA